LLFASEETLVPIQNVFLYPNLNKANRSWCWWPAPKKRFKGFFHTQNSAKPTLGVWGLAPKKRLTEARIFHTQNSAKPTQGVLGLAPKKKELIYEK
jgi:hypothetical protein